MNQNMNQQNNPVDFGNDWGFYVDIENPHSPNNKHKPFRDKYNKNRMKEPKNSFVRTMKRKSSSCSNKCLNDRLQLNRPR